VQVHDEGSTFRGKLKKEARKIVQHCYNLFPDLEGAFGEAEYNGIVARNAKMWLESGAYMRGGKDAHVRCTPMVTGNPSPSLIPIRVGRTISPTQEFANSASIFTTHQQTRLPPFIRILFVINCQKKPLPSLAQRYVNLDCLPALTDSNNYQIHCALQEWLSGIETTVPFTGAVYSGVYDSIFTLIQDVKADRYHGEKLDAMLRHWAREGR